jgi:hypothetical protein
MDDLKKILLQIFFLCNDAAAILSEGDASFGIIIGNRQMLKGLDDIIILRWPYM